MKLRFQIYLVDLLKTKMKFNSIELRKELGSLLVKAFSVDLKYKYLYDATSIFSFLLTFLASISLIAVGTFNERVTLEESTRIGLQLKLQLLGLIGFILACYSITGCYLICCAKYLHGKVSKSET